MKKSTTEGNEQTGYTNPYGISRTARRGRKYRRMKKKNETVEWIKAIVTAVVVALLIRHFVFELILVDGHSMLPTLHDSDRIVVSKIGYRFNQPRQFDIIVFKYPEDPRYNYVKRVIALEGDRVRIDDEVVYVNDQPLEEPYILEPPLSDYPEVVVPEDTVFALGDNRNQSKDSRDDTVGFIPIDNILGQAKAVVWPIGDLAILD